LPAVLEFNRHSLYFPINCYLWNETRRHWTFELCGREKKK